MTGIPHMDKIALHNARPSARSSPVTGRLQRLSAAIITAPSSASAHTLLYQFRRPSRIRLS